jgi:hypothetical protein
MSSRANREKGCSKPPKTGRRPYDNRPGSGLDQAKRRSPCKADAISVDLPDELTLTPEAAWALLRILIKDRDRRNGIDQIPGAAE